MTQSILMLRVVRLGHSINFLEPFSAACTVPLQRLNPFRQTTFAPFFMLIAMPEPLHRPARAVALHQPPRLRTPDTAAQGRADICGVRAAINSNSPAFSPYARSNQSGADSGPARDNVQRILRCH